MICVIRGLFVEKTKKKDKDGKDVAVAVLYSDGEVVKIDDCPIKDDLLNTNIEVLCSVKLRTFDGRTYMTVKHLRSAN